MYFHGYVPTGLKLSLDIIFHSLIVALVDSGIHGYHISYTWITIYISPQKMSALIAWLTIFTARYPLFLIIARVVRVILRHSLAVSDSPHVIGFINRII
ncbi:Uncharacterised protein [uncultured Ruminococcus sp.]|nr:Uncharacterised protein [uncultured Ruminococcus sp.]